MPFYITDKDNKVITSRNTDFTARMELGNHPFDHKQVFSLYNYNVGDTISVETKGPDAPERHYTKVQKAKPFLPTTAPTIEAEIDFKGLEGQERADAIRDFIKANRGDFGTLTALDQHIAGKFGCGETTVRDIRKNKTFPERVKVA